MKDFFDTGGFKDPKKKMGEVADCRRVKTKISAEESLFILALRVENDRYPLMIYQSELLRTFRNYYNESIIDRFFKKMFDHAGKFKKANLVPLDKWRPENIDKFNNFLATINQLPNRLKFHFCDEKHIVNKDCVGNKMRADPLSGRVRCIHVSGNFCFAYNMIAIMSLNPNKTRPMAYTLGEENGTAACFTAFIQNLLIVKWFQPGDVLVMDNAAIHSGAEAGIIKDLLWEQARVLVVELPTRSPELNPIELIFHILARRLRSFRYHREDPRDLDVPSQASAVMNDITTELVLKRARHCGY